ncbi:3-oxoacyl-ACP synthase III family protein [Actinomadura rugatobispora]|uniref:3-oxoacyl-ACP synthase III family protein n=1 Tax=Actinomadura rugatobispora TaxID=1994 RepID=A0ABW0ZPG2_9ACTN|nr:ketoacyl-ACP synthase III [Actinomadura rugatobispora]
MSTTYTRLAAVAAHLPETTLTTAELEERLAERNPGLDLPRGLILDGSGVRRRHVADPSDRPSDLAAAAGRKLLDEHGVHPGDLDLIIYAGVSSDLVEPATGHVVAAKLGADCPVFDVRNACNSVLNAIEVADTLIGGGRYRRVLICCGELPSAITPWTVGGTEEFFTVAASYTVSDAGAALLLEAGGSPGVLAHAFTAYSAAWEAAVVPVLDFNSDPLAGPPRLGPLVVSGVKLLGGFEKIDSTVFHKPLADLGLTWDDMAAICVHQASLPMLWKFCDHVGIPPGKVVVTIAQHGNMVAATLPVQLAMAVESGRVRRGDLVAMIGLASGVSAGIAVVRW